MINVPFLAAYATYAYIYAIYAKQCSEYSAPVGHLRRLKLNSVVGVN